VSLTDGESNAARWERSRAASHKKTALLPIIHKNERSLNNRRDQPFSVRYLLSLPRFLACSGATIPADPRTMLVKPFINR